jgi:hydrogenase nickel incorporation protein HypA/HybF
MHELSIAMSIVDAAVEQSHRHGDAKVLAIHLKLGPLAGVVKEALNSAWELATEKSPVEGSKLFIQDMPLIVYCPTCQQEKQIESIQEMRCPTCGSYTPDIRGGREMEIVAMEIE